MVDSPWDFKQWQLTGDDIVILGLGSNDYSGAKEYWPSYHQFYQGYYDLITFVQTNYNSTGYEKICNSTGTIFYWRAAFIAYEDAIISTYMI
jgi:hypothetical protein